MSELGSYPAPYPYLRIGYLSVPRRFERSSLLWGIGTRVDLEVADLTDELKYGLDLVVVEASDLESPRVLDVLIACEGAGIPTVLSVVHVEDLHSSIAGVVSHMVTINPAAHREALAQVGTERALLLNAVADPAEVLLDGIGSVGALTPEAITRRRRIIETQSPKTQADALASFLGFTVEPPPLVTAVVVSRRAENLDVSLANLKRQQYPRLDALLTVDPMYEQAARKATARWDIPVRIVVSQAGSTLADRLNLGVSHVNGELVTVVEENALYGSHHVTDLVQAIQHAGAHIVGKASWHVFDAARGEFVIRASGLQRSFGATPALGTIMLRRETAQAFGFSRRASGTNWPLPARLMNAGGNIYSVHAYDTVLPKRGQALREISTRAPGSGALPFENF